MRYIGSSRIVVDPPRILLGDVSILHLVFFHAETKLVERILLIPNEYPIVPLHWDF
jgi:hypothetical protein